MAEGEPTGSDLASVTINITDLPKEPSTTRTIFTFDTPYQLGSNVDYAVIIGTSGVVIGDLIQWGQDTGAGFAGGQGFLSSDSGASWSAVPTRDRAFAIQDSNGDRDLYALVNAYQADYDPFYVGQSFNSAAQAYIAVGVELPLRKTTTSPSGTVTISLRLIEIAAPGKPINPVPADSATGITLDQATLSWDTGGNTDTYDVYFGLSGNMSLVSSAQAGTSWAIDSLPLIYGTSYQWRVDATNAQFTTTGDTWSFTTLTFAPPSLANWQIIKRLCAAANGKFWYESI